ncbi:MAG: YitT family protein [Oscillospiraceae bacterium]|nr:YitT family protein [Oscillospiraceae bacterium]
MSIGIRKAAVYVNIILAALILALNYYVFIVDNQFAPAGLNGIATMIQYKTGFSISFMSLIINIPLCIMSFCIGDREFAVKTLIFSVVYSAAFLLLQQSGMNHIKYDAQGHDTVFPVVISGVISGLVYSMCLKSNASTGGTDIVSRHITRVKPSVNFFILIFILNAVVAFISLFVYSDSGYLDYKPVALCITYCFISNFVGNYIIKGTKNAYKFTIITTHADEIALEISGKLKHSTTKIDAMGTYTSTSKSVLICVINRHQLVDLKNILKGYDDTFAFSELVTETYGNFVHVK